MAMWTIHMWTQAMLARFLDIILGFLYVKDGPVSLQIWLSCMDGYSKDAQVTVA
jgi:hypothetical protein